MQLKLISPMGEESANIDVSPIAFGRDFNEHLVHQVVTSYLHNARRGTKANKSRADVRGGGKKPHAQKGTGRARAGTIRSPLWRSGGVTFAAQPRTFSHKVNKKMFRGAMCSILSELVRLGRLFVVKDFALEAPKTRDLVQKLKDMKIDEALIIVKDWDANLFLSARNLVKVDVYDADKVTPVNLIKSKNIIITEEALRELEEALA